MQGRHAASAALLPGSRLTAATNACTRRALYAAASRAPLSTSSSAHRRPSNGSFPAAAADIGCPPCSSRASAALRHTNGSSRSFATFRGGFGGFPGFGGGGQPAGDTEKFYKLLGLDKNASDSDIKKAYKKEAMKHHPDRGGDEATFKDISRAYEVLSNPEKKQIYDTYGEQGLEGMEQGGGGPGAGGADPFDLFSQIFGFNAGGGRQRRGRPTTPDSTYELQLSLEELYSGTNRSIVFNRDALCGDCEGYGGQDHSTCSRCDGTGQQVTMHQMGMFVQQVQSVCQSCGGKGYIIPRGKDCKTCKSKGTIKERKTFNIDVEPGCSEGTEFKFRKQADEALGHDTGDVRIIIQQKPHSTFKRIENNLVMSKKVSLSDALVGFQFATTFLDGEELTIRSSPGQVYKPGDMMVIKGKGMPRSHSGRPGDLFLIVDIDFPDTVPEENCEGLAELLGGKPLPVDAPDSAEESKKLTLRETQELKQSWSQRARRQQQQQQGGGGAECQQM